MSRRIFLALLVASVFLGSIGLGVSNAGYVPADWPGGLIIDHNCIDLNTIPQQWIDAAQANVKIHYAHTSHGSQVTTGLTRLEAANSTFDVSIVVGSLPTESGTLCMLDGNPPHSYITPDLYWQGEPARAITQNTIDDNPTVTLSLWSWCTQLNSYDTAGTQEYLDAMTMLENANPSITFVYMTSNAQADGSTGYNRWVNNEMVRQYCLDNNKILFDFADLDCYSNGDYHTYEYTVGEETYNVPLEHPDFNGDEAGHTTYTSCEQKGRAFWWLVATLAGWDSPTTTATTSTSTSSTSSTTTTGSTITATDELLVRDILILSAIVGCLIVVVIVMYRK